MKKDNPKSLQVFLSHATEDKSSVIKLFDQLKKEKWINPWLYSEKLLPGQNWRLEIELAVRTADIVIICLSNSSLTKEGYFRKEISFALDTALEKLDETIYIIPLRFEQCTVPHSLCRWQWVDYFQDTGYSNLIRALEIRAEKLGISVNGKTSVFSAIQLLELEISKWQITNLPISEESLELLYEHRHELASLSEEEWKCILHSAVTHDNHVYEWFAESGNERIPQIMELFSNGTDQTQNIITYSLIKWNNRNVILPLMEILAIQKSMKPSIKEVLLSFGQDIASQLEATVNHSSVEVRDLAIDVLTQVHGKKALILLYKFLNDKNEILRSKACLSVATFDEELVNNIYITKLLFDESPVVRKSAICAIKDLGIIDQTKILIDLMEDNDLEVQKAAIRALGSLKANDALSILIDKLQVSDEDICKIIIGALGEIENSEAISVLVTTANKENLRNVSIIALGRIQSQDAIQVLKKILPNSNLDDIDWVINNILELHRAISSIGSQCGSVAIPLLDELLLSGWLKSAAEKALKEIGTKAALRALHRREYETEEQKERARKMKNNRLYAW